jgi:hypothetical protein
VFLGNNGIDESMEEIVVTGRREDEPNFNVRNAILRGASAPYQDGTLDPDLRGSLMMEDDIGYDEAYNYAQEMKNLNPDVSYKGQGMDNFVKGAKKIGNKLYDTAAMASTGIGNIPIAGLAYKNAIAGSNPIGYFAAKQLAPGVMKDFNLYAGGGSVDETRPRSAERRPYFRVPDRETGEYDDIRLGRLRNVFTRLLREPTDEDSTGKKLALLAGEIGLSPFKVADMFLEFSTGATPIDSLNLYYDRPERVFRDSPGVSKYSPYNVERKDYTEEFSPEEFRQYRPNDEGPRPSFIPGFQDGGSVEDKSTQFQIDRVMMAVNRLMELGVSEEEARAVVQRHLELGPYPEQVPGEGGKDPFKRDYNNNDSMRPLNDEMFITEDGLDLREADGTSLNNFDEMNYKAHGGQVRRRVPDMYFGRYNMGGAVAPGQVSKPPMPTGNPMLKQITNTDPRYYSPPPNPMGNLAGGISNLANNQKKTNKLLGGNNQNNNAMNQNLKISYNPNPTNKDQRLVFSNVLESTRPV